MSTERTILRDAETLRDCVDGFLLTDNQYGQPHMAPSYAAGILQANGYAPILQISCRNRNRIALIGELLGARAAGIDSLMLVRGGVLPEGYSPRPKAVMDTDAKELVATASIIDQNEELGETGRWLIGTSATVHSPSPDAQPTELLAKAEAGARLVIAQICHDLNVVRRYMEFLIANRLLERLSVVISIAVPGSADAARWLIANRRGTVINDGYVEALDSAADAESTAVETAAALVTELTTIPGVAGVNFASIHDVGLILRVMERVAAAT